MFVISYTLEQTFPVKSLLLLKIAYYLLIEQVRSLNYLHFLLIFHYVWRQILLVTKWTYVKGHSLRLVHFVPRMVPYFFNCYSLFWISNEYLLYHVLTRR